MITRIGGHKVVRNKILLPQWECIATSMGAIGVFRLVIAPCEGVYRIIRIALQAMQCKSFRPFSKNTLFYLCSSQSGRP